MRPPALLNHPSCGARTRSGAPCKGVAMANGRCRMHGGPSTGPKTPEGMERVRRANTRHGQYTAEHRELMQLIRELRADARETARRILKG
jgi:hypothetical protein